MFERMKLVRSAVRLVRNPEGLDEVFALVDSIAAISDLGTVIDEIRRSSTAADRAFRDRVRIAPITLEELAAMPPGSLGAAFADYCASGKLDPAIFFGRPASTDIEYMSAHLYETHDIWHVVTGIGTDVDSELGLQAFYLAQFTSHLALTLLTLGLFRTLLLERHTYRGRLDAISSGWVLGKKTRPLFGIEWSLQWQRPLSEIRVELGLDAAPEKQRAA